MQIIYSLFSKIMPKRQLQALSVPFFGRKYQYGQFAERSTTVLSPCATIR